MLAYTMSPATESGQVHTMDENTEHTTTTATATSTNIRISLPTEDSTLGTEATHTHTQTQTPPPAGLQVAIRIRPQSERELVEEADICVQQMPGDANQIVLGRDKSYSFDQVYPPELDQKSVYNGCVKGIVDKCVQGYNTTILAYGQTGTGKTYTMGSGSDTLSSGVPLDQQGIIPRTVRDIYAQLESSTTAEDREGADDGQNSPNKDGTRQEGGDTGKNRNSESYAVSVSFIELYNDTIVDLLHPSADLDSTNNLTPNQVSIVEDRKSGETYLKGVTKVPSKDADEVFAHLRRGSDARTTASTNMNATSSRSHAILTIHLTRTSSLGVTTTSKFNFVDLAGSERLKRTNATGDRAKEGISINSGLLALGNVISALGDLQTKRERRRESPAPTPGASPKHSRGVSRHTSMSSGRRGLGPTPPLKNKSVTSPALSVSQKDSNSFIPYRSSKLTRLLKDSLGGNSLTLMIACISPSDGDFMETRNTVNYANRAKKIKNKPVVLSQLAGGAGIVNAELVAEVTALKSQLHKLQVENLAQKEMIKTSIRERELESAREQIRRKTGGASACRKCEADIQAGGQTANTDGERGVDRGGGTVEGGGSPVGKANESDGESIHDQLAQLTDEEIRAEQTIAVLKSVVADRDRDIYQLLCHVSQMSAGDNISLEGVPRVNSSVSLNLYRMRSTSTSASQASTFRRGSEISIGGSFGSLGASLHSRIAESEAHASGLRARPIKSFDTDREPRGIGAAKSTAANTDDGKSSEGGNGDSVDDLLDKYKHLAEGPDPEVLQIQQQHVEEIIATETFEGQKFKTYNKLVHRRTRKVAEKKEVEAQLKKLILSYSLDGVHNGEALDADTKEMVHNGPQNRSKRSPSVHDNDALQEQIEMVSILIEDLDLEVDTLNTEMRRMEHELAEMDNPEHILEDFVRTLDYSEMLAMIPYLVKQTAETKRELLTTMEG
ncbi:hypothetical protein SARC_04998 [Sphaeroforma arctica JP610]|uniref:Kinesin-like protein n=1 Tax=Sphaeroforma arctica JP610 TaxID=667725 RepID=A0A0L0G0T8_9EUKA|nr:hypothetical protein SARC_04998 [Sphaeroforma arctica JP610]KNC82727.1 hypothetical protein SARC_04998 [Sphaeroforma arctica JP610]|eukprot:XP_014156629.1 hypothetical protein SARC_04998 [Sphaeroforma arctica JP610]